MPESTLPSSWPLAGALETLVLNFLRQDAETVGLLSQPGIDFDTTLRQRLERGRAACNTTTMALWYCYTYMLMHLDAYTAMMRHQYPVFEELLIDSGPELLMIDFGCGPLTSPLAMAEYILQCPCGVILSYIGIDHMIPMLQKAAEFASHVFRPFWKPTLQPSWDCVELPGTPKPKKLLFNFSYFFGQRLTKDQIRSCASFVKNVLLSCKVDTAYLIYLNKDGRGYQDNYVYFKQILELTVQTIAPIEYQYRRFRRLRFAGYSRPEPSLHQEIIKLDWRRYVRA